MENKLEQQGNPQDKHQGNRHADAGSGQQGIDKAPGEEPMQENVQFAQDALKGKKVDADLDQEKDRPADQPSV